MPNENRPLKRLDAAAAVEYLQPNLHHPMTQDLPLRLLEQLAAREPRRTAELAIDLLVRVTGAAAGGLFLAASPRPWLAANQGIAQPEIDRVAALWSEHRKQFPRQPVTNGGFVLTLVDRIALVYLQGARLVSVAESIEMLKGVLSRVARELLERPQTEDPQETYLKTTPLEQIERTKLLLLLEDNEWNLSRVARILHLSRVTIYNKLDYFGIPRQHRRKT